MDSKILHKLSYGVYVVGSMDGERPVGCIANSVMQITSSPAIVAVSLNRDNYTNVCVNRTGLLSVSVLAQSCDPSVIGTFGFQSSRAADKFSAVDFSIKSGAPVLTNTVGYMVLKVKGSFETATHTVFFAEMIDGAVTEQDTPMTYAYYHEVVKGKSPKNAPTYQAPAEKDVSKKSAYVCSICGYEYDGESPFEELPDDYVCPICGQPKSAFVKK